MVRACQAGLQRAAQARRAPRERGDGGASPDLAYDVEEVVDVRLFMAWCHRPASRAQPLARACSGTGGASGRSAARLRRLGSSRRVGAVTSAVPKSVFSSTERETTHPRSRKSSERERERTLAAKMWISNFRKVLGLALGVFDPVQHWISRKLRYGVASRRLRRRGESGCRAIRGSSRRAVGSIRARSVSR